MRIGVFLACLSLATLSRPLAAEEAPFGVWLVEDGEGAIEMLPCPDGASLCGRLAWLKPNNSGLTARDRNNPDPSLRDQPLCGLVLMTGFVQDEAGVWRDGAIYNPDDGRRYAATIRRDGPDRLRLRGYFLTPVLGATQIWTRAPETLGRCSIS